VAKNDRKVKTIGILTAGGDCPGLNAAIRGVAKSGDRRLRNGGHSESWNGFAGLVENRVVPINDRVMSGLLTSAGRSWGRAARNPTRCGPDGNPRT